MKKVFSKDKMQHGVHHPILALDIENDSKTGAFICAGLYGKIKKRIHRKKYANKETVEIDVKEYFTNLSDLHEYLLSLKAGSCILVFYNLSYDIVYLRDILKLPKLNKNGTIKKVYELTVGTRTIVAYLKNDIKCIDLFNHTCEGSLESWSNYCKFYEQFGVKKESLKDLHLRVMTDSELTFHLGEFLEDFYYYECGIPLQLTVGASALKLFATKYFKDYWLRDNDDLISSYEREAYFGGRTELFKRGKIIAHSYDINSTYLSIMRDCLIPDVTTFRYRKDTRFIDKDLGKNLDKHLSIIECNVTTPDDLYIGILPVRINNKLSFPKGTFTGKWCNIELIEAVKNDYKINEIKSYIFYNQSKKYFSEYADFVWKKRIEYRKKDNVGMDKMIKRLGNSLYGKFGERHQTKAVFKYDDLKVIESPIYEIFEYLGELYVRLNVGEKVSSKHDFPCIPAFITAYARIKLLKGILANKNSIVYCDTDSMKIIGDVSGIKIGDDLGEWKDENISELEFYRSKFYGDKHKGVPKNAGEFCLISDKELYINNTIDHKNFIYEKPIREREAMRRNLIPNVWNTITKTLLLTDDKREWNGVNSIPKIFSN